MTEAIISSRLEGVTLVVETDSGTETYDSQFLVAALLVFVARGSGTIEPAETAKMLQLIESHFQLQGSKSLELLMRAMSEMTEKPGLEQLLIKLGQTLSNSEKEDVAVMALKVVAADGNQQAKEMESFYQVVEAVGIAPEIVHRAFDRYFAETQPGD